MFESLQGAILLVQERKDAETVCVLHLLAAVDIAY
jgi:hypothetical protein